MLKETLIYEKMPDSSVKCGICPWNCVLKPNKIGNCRTRKNIDGTLYSMIYGKISSMAVDPVEKKPLYHFYPGSMIFSISSIGCNFHCKHCQNASISQVNFDEHSLQDFTPEQIVSLTKRKGCNLIAYTYNEPLIWLEFILDTAILAHQEGIKNVLVTNGYITLEALEVLAPYVDAANVDIKAFTDEFYQKIVGVPSLKPVLNSLKFMKEKDIFLECTNLLIPTLNDSMKEIEQLTTWILKNLGPFTPLHFSAFRPMYKLKNIPSTPLETILAACKKAKEIGLHHVFAGNVYAAEFEHTFCPKCGALLIERHGYRIKRKNLTFENHCMKCDVKINILGDVKENSQGFLWF
ncbi:MAG: AmmeMemoRadiSam system radical SAM enzyme [Candidatus Helarchaeota archaeon]